MYLRIDSRDGTPIYKQIAREIRHAVALGALKPQDRLPSVRELAQQLTVNPNTVAKAYRELEHQGLVEARHGSGSFVRDRAVALSMAERRGIVAHLIDEALLEARHLQLPERALAALVQERLERLETLERREATKP